MIIRTLAGMSGSDKLRCTLCKAMTEVDPLVIVPLNRVQHNCEEGSWVVPDPPPVRRGGQSG